MKVRGYNCAQLELLSSGHLQAMNMRLL